MRAGFPWTALVICGLLACNGGDSEGDARLRVVVTTTQIGDFAREVGGDRIALTVLLEPNREAHDFAPRPSQLRRIGEAELILRNGVGLDDFVGDALEAAKADVVVVTAGVALRGGEDEADPHVWFAVANAKTMVANLRDAFAGADAANAAAYAAAAERYLAALDELDAAIRRQIAMIAPACRKLVTNHDVLGYYAAAYGLEVVGAVIPSLSSDAQASAADVAEIVRRIQAEKVPAVFADASSNPALVRQVGREADVAVIDDLYGDSLGPAGSDGATYVAMMEANTARIVAALKGCDA